MFLKENWSFGIEFEVDGSIRSSSSSNIIDYYKLDEKRKVGVRVYGDISTQKEYRKIEIVTYPLFFKEKQKIQEVNKISTKICEIFTSIALAHQRLLDEKGDINEIGMYSETFKRTLDEKCALEDYVSNILEQKKIVIAPKFEGNICLKTSNAQLTIGVPYSDVDELFLHLQEYEKDLWYQSAKYSSNLLNEQNNRIYNLVLCEVDFYQHLMYDKEDELNVDVTSSLMKNKWKVMPRTPVANIVSTEVKKQLFANSTIIESEVRKNILKKLVENMISLGHVSTIENLGTPQLVFEWRTQIPLDVFSKLGFIGIS